MIKALFSLGFVIAALSAPSFAFAHPGAGFAHEHGFGALSGLLHPFSGVDHLLAMVAVGMVATLLGGRALWLVPASFLGMMALGSALGMAGFDLPFVETGIGLSVAIFGLIVAGGLKMPVAASIGLVGFFALFHGHAHGTEMPAAASVFAYGAAFLLATALLHGIGIGLAVLGNRLNATSAQTLQRAAGCAMSLAGIAFLTGAF